MPINDLTGRIYNDPAFRDIAKNLQKGTQLSCRGLSYSLQSFFLTYLVEKQKKQILFLADSVDAAEKLRDDISLILPEETMEILLPAENYPYCSSDIDDERKGNRLLALEKLYKNDFKILISTYRNLFEKIPLPAKFSNYFISLKKGGNIEMEILAGRLIDSGFERVTTVENIGEFSQKGSIIDIYPFAAEFPVRLELFGDEIESLRFFEPSDQKKVGETDELVIYLNDIKAEKESANLLDFIDDKTVIFLENTDQILDKFNHYYEKQIIEGYHRLKDEIKPEYQSKYFSPLEVNVKLSPKTVLLERTTDSNIDFRLPVRDQGSFRYDLKNFLEALRNDKESGFYAYILCDNPGQAERFREILEEERMVSPKIKVIVGGLHQGFIYTALNIAVYTDHQIFGRIRRPKSYRRFKKAVPLKDFKRLIPGDFIVHMDHGVGQFLGLEKITVAGSVSDVLKLLYRDGDILYVKLNQIHLIQKYSASEGVLPLLSKLGTKNFKNLRERTKTSVKNIARELIAVYAKRKAAQGFAFPYDTVWQTEMESSFEFEDTPDQAKATVDFKKDMESRMPMDRLVCGDVGFGKTEVAIRAAFKAVNGGKQVAVLAPTTILVHQHYENFKKRIDRYPYKIEVLSRFKTPREQKQTLLDLQDGKIDILIGTHRLLSGDVKYKDLGLLVVDEEQRFGVTHKEKIKELKVNVDVLTLTATPIPRTLHMSLMGVRDLSLINTPPVNRLPINTEVHPYNEDIIFEAIMKEIDRGGQVFFVHNRVETIEKVKENLQRIVPDVAIAVAHGQMQPKQLEGIMFDFMYKKYDVLIATTIVESGVDIPNVNTLIINSADMFGLAQLYQLRGRIGRSSRQAYAYFLIHNHTNMSPIARKRLDTICEYTDLGSGFQIAMKDLEIRGAGNLLGSEQSGHIENVGFDLYTRILEEAVVELKNEEFSEILKDAPVAKKINKASVSFRQKMYLPEYYINEDAERVEIYRRLMNCQSIAEVEEIRKELHDRFGKEPTEVANLFDNLNLSILAGGMLVKNVVLMVEDNYKWYLKFYFDLEAMAEEENQAISQKIGTNMLKIRQEKVLDIRIDKDGEILNFFPPNFATPKRVVSRYSREVQAPDPEIEEIPVDYAKLCLDMLMIE